MTRHISRERIIYGLVITLAVIALALVMASPSSFMDNTVVYQAF